MFTRTLTLTAAAAGLTLALSACTSENADPGPSTDATAVTSDDGLEGTAGSQGWMCQYVSPTAVELAAGGQAESPRGLVTQDDDETWACEVLVGGAGEQEPVVRVGIHLGEEARDDARARAEGAAGVERGPEHLGVSFISPGMVTGLTLCSAPDPTAATQKIPYSLVIESLGETDEKTTEHLQRSLTEAAKGLDRSVGCSPKQAFAEDAEQSTAP